MCFGRALKNSSKIHLAGKCVKRARQYLKNKIFITKLESCRKEEKVQKEKKIQKHTRI
jgi:hypothetical protein